MRAKFSAEDVPQDVFVQTWEMAALYDPSRCKPMPWAIMLTRNKPIDLAFFSSLMQTEISERLRLPLGTVKVCIRRGMMRLKELIRPGR